MTGSCDQTAPLGRLVQVDLPLSEEKRSTLMFTDYTYRLLYTLGRLDKLNFQLTEEERIELDALGVGGVVALALALTVLWW